MKCVCGYDNEQSALFCRNCGKSMSPDDAAQASAPAQAPGEKPPENAAAPPSPAIAPPPPMPPRPPMPPPPMHPHPPAPPPPHYYTPYPPPRTPIPPFTTTDVFCIIGFVLAIFGVFTYAYILIPASIIFSVIAWRRKTNRRTKGIAVASLVIGICAAVIKLAQTLYELGWIPDWLSRGIF